MQRGVWTRRFWCCLINLLFGYLHSWWLLLCCFCVSVSMILCGPNSAGAIGYVGLKSWALERLWQSTASWGELIRRGGQLRGSQWLRVFAWLFRYLVVSNYSGSNGFLVTIVVSRQNGDERSFQTEAFLGEPPTEIIWRYLNQNQGVVCLADGFCSWRTLRYPPQKLQRALVYSSPGLRSPRVRMRWVP